MKVKEKNTYVMEKQFKGKQNWRRTDLLLPPQFLNY